MGGPGSGKKLAFAEVRGLSLKVPEEVYRRLIRQRDAKNATVAELMRRYVIEGLERDEAFPDPESAALARKPNQEPR